MSQSSLNHPSCKQLLRLLAATVFLTAATAHAGLNISGVKKKLSTNIQALIDVADLPCDTPRWHLQEKRRQLIPQVETALQPFGYYHPQVTVSINNDPECWNIDLKIDPGPQTLLRQIDVRHIDQEQPLPDELQELLDYPPLQTTAPLLHSAYDEYRNSLIETAQELGFWQAKLERSELAIYPADNVADVHLHLFTGPRYHFGKMSFNPTPLNEGFLRRLAGDLYDQEYSHDTLNSAYKRLQNSDYFNSVVISPQVEGADINQEVPLNVQLAMRSKHSFSVGTGYSTDQGARVKGTSKNRYLNSDGHKLQTELLWSEKQQDLATAYTIPLQDPTREWLVLEAGYVKEDTDTYESKSTRTGIQHIQVLPYDWSLKTAVNINHEDYIIGEDIDTTLLVMPEIKLSWVTPQKPIRLRKGMRLEMRLLTSREEWLSDTNFVQGEVLGKWILPVGDKDRLLTRVQAASTWIDDFTDLPPSVRMFAGGDNSIRGYAFESVGETDSNGDVIGGSHLLVGSIEYDHLLAKHWSVSAFTDAGDAFDNTLNLNRSVGVGVRWYSPLGPLRVDLAHPLDDDASFRIHISLGADL